MYPGRRHQGRGPGAAVPSADGQAAVVVAPGRGGGGRHRRGDGDATGHRGSRAAAGGGHKKECPAPCSGPTAAALPLLQVPGPAPGPVPGVAVPVRGMGVGAEGRRFPTAGRQWRWRRGGSRLTRAGVMAGYQGWASPRGPGEGGGPLRLVPGGRIRGLRATTPMMVNTLVGLSVRSFPRSQGGAVGVMVPSVVQQAGVGGRVGSGRCPGRQVTGVRFQPDWRLPPRRKKRPWCSISET